MVARRVRVVRVCRHARDTRLTAAGWRDARRRDGFA
jgi:hypothetical protein